MRNYRAIILLTISLVACKSSQKKEAVVSLPGNSLSTIFEQLMSKSNPFEFYKTVFENFRFELKSTLIQPNQPTDVLPPESVTVYESNDQEESRFYKKSLEPISEVEWMEKQSKDYIRYDDNKHFLRTSYNPEFEKWKKGIFQDIQSTFDLKALENVSVTTEKNQWSCYQNEQQKICLDTKTGLPVFGKAIKQLKPDVAVSMVFSLVYGEDAVSQINPGGTGEKKAPSQEATKQPLRGK